MKKTDGHPPCKRPRLVSRLGSTVLTSVSRAAVIQPPSNVGGSLADVAGSVAKPITFDDSSNDSSGGASVSKVNNNEIVSFYLLIFSCMYMDVC